MDRKCNDLWGTIIAEICDPMNNLFATDYNGTMIELVLCSPKVWRTQFLKLQAQIRKE